MKKVYTLTLTNTKNYGALLQAFALKDFILKSGFACEVINYYNPAMAYSQVSGWRKLRSIIWSKTLGRLLENRCRTQKTLLFKGKYLDYSEKRYSSVEELNSLNQDAYAFIVGSDQVWNRKVNANDSAFFLSFAEKRKIAYAASFGTNDVSKAYLTENKSFLEAFDSLSVRETSGKEILLRLLSIDSKIVLDPVFLLNKEEWASALLLSDMRCRPFVLCYIMPGDREVVKQVYKIARTIAEEKGLRIIVVGERTYKLSSPNITMEHGCGPTDFVNLLMNANYVVTNSFHGSAFSIIFEKEFFSVINESESGLNTRVKNLLASFQLGSRLLTSVDSFNTSILDSEVHYESMASIKADLVNNSKSFLLDSLNGE